MRIALIYLGRRGSGGPISLELTAQLSRRTETFAVISRQVENYPRWQVANLDFVPTSTYRSFWEAAWTWTTQVKIARLARQIRARRPDVLLVPMIHTWTPFLQWHLREIPSVVTVHDPVPHPGLFDWFDAQFQNQAMRQATRCIILSESLRDELSQRGVSPDQIDVVPHGELSYYQRLSAPVKSSPPQIPTLFFFGRITAYKGLETLFQAYRRLPAASSTRLLIVGSGDFSPYESLLEGLNGVEVVNRWIPEEEVSQFFERATIMVLPYTSASQSGVLAIAASYGLPVIATHIGGLPEQIEDGETGLLVAPHNPEQLEQAIRKLLDDPKLAQRLGQNLQARQQQVSNWNRVAELTLQVCRKACRR